MSCQPGRTRHTTRPNPIGPTLFIIEIIPSLGSPDPGYSQKQMIAICVLGCDLAWDELMSQLDDEALGEQEIGVSES